MDYLSSLMSQTASTGCEFFYQQCLEYSDESHLGKIVLIAVPLTVVALGCAFCCMRFQSELQRVVEENRAKKLHLKEMYFNTIAKENEFLKEECDKLSQQVIELKRGKSVDSESIKQLQQLNNVLTQKVQHLKDQMKTPGPNYF